MTNVAQVLRMVIGVVLVPFVIRRIGIEGYGSWVLVMALFSQLGAPTSGFQWAYARFAAELEQEGKLAELASVLGAGALSLSLLTAFIGAICWLFSDQALAALGVPSDLLVSTALAVNLIIVAAVARALGGAPVHVLVGLQRTDLRFALDIVDSLVYATTAVVLLSRGAGLEGLALGVLGGQVVSLLAGALLCKRLYPQVLLSPLRASREGLRKIVAVGGRYQVLVVLSELSQSGRTLAIGAVGGAATVGIFGLAERLVILARTPSNSIIAPLLPAFASLSAAGDRLRLHHLLRFATKLAIATAVPVFVFVCGFAEELLLAWTGSFHPKAVVATWVLTAVSLLMTASAVPLTHLRARGVLGIEMQLLAVGGAAMVAGAAMGFTFAGFAGLLTAVALIGLGSQLWFLGRFDRSQDPGMLGHVASVVSRSVLVCLGPILIAKLVAHLAMPGFADNSRASQLLGLGMVGAPFALASALGLFRVLFPARERADMLALLGSRQGGAKD